MGILDDTLRQLTQGGNGDVSQPLLVVFQELLTGKPQDGTASAAPQQQAQTPQANRGAQGQQQGQDAAGAELGGLGGLLAQLQAAGLDDAVRSWVGTGENKSVHPDALGDALGKPAVNQMADKAGCDANDFLSQLAKALPGIIDQLTHDGRVPNSQEIGQRLQGR